MDYPLAGNRDAERELFKRKMRNVLATPAQADFWPPKFQGWAKRVDAGCDAGVAIAPQLVAAFRPLAEGGCALVK